MASAEARKNRTLAPDAQKPHPLGKRLFQEDLEVQTTAFGEHYNHSRYYESLDNLTPAHVYFGRSQTILLEREWIRRETIKKRRLIQQAKAA